MELEYFVIGAAEIGYSYTRQDVINLVEVLCRKGTPINVSHRWWEGFKRRHPNVTLKKPKPLSHARLNGAHPTVFTNYFDELEAVLNDNDIKYCPSLIFHMAKVVSCTLNHHFCMSTWTKTFKCYFIKQEVSNYCFGIL